MSTYDENTPPKSNDNKLKIKTISIGAFRKIPQTIIPLISSTEATQLSPTQTITIKLPSFHPVLSPNVSTSELKEESRVTKIIPSISIKMPTLASSTPEPRLATAIANSPILKMPRIEIVAPSANRTIEASTSKPSTPVLIPSITIRSPTDQDSAPKEVTPAFFASSSATPSFKIIDDSASSRTDQANPTVANHPIRSISIGSSRDREYMFSLLPKRTILPDLLDAENFDFNKNNEAFDCPICFVEIETGEGVVLKNCIHKFCKDCLVAHVGHSEDYEVKCPFSDEMGICELLLQDREIRALLNQEAFEKHLSKSLRRYGASESAFHCRTTDCPGIIDKDENLRGFTCQVCRKVNCIRCKAIHSGISCQEYQAKLKRSTECSQSEATIKRLIENEEAMWCPKCIIPVMKVDGCDFITCSACKLGICWITKKPRQPFRRENGELVDGCHCDKKNGKPCHPKCKYCH